MYRIRKWRFDVPVSTHSTPSFIGETVEECDEKAKKHFKQISDLPENEWEGMNISRIDAPAVGEKTTFLMENGRQNNDDWVLSHKKSAALSGVAHFLF